MHRCMEPTGRPLQVFRVQGDRPQQQSHSNMEWARLTGDGASPSRLGPFRLCHCLHVAGNRGFWNGPCWICMAVGFAHILSRDPVLGCHLPMMEPSGVP